MENVILRLKEIRNVADEALQNSKVRSDLKVRYKHLLQAATESNNKPTSILNIIATN